MFDYSKLIERQKKKIEKEKIQEDILFNELNAKARMSANKLVDKFRFSLNKIIDQIEDDLNKFNSFLIKTAEEIEN